MFVYQGKYWTSISKQFWLNEYFGDKSLVKRLKLMQMNLSDTIGIIFEET